MGYVKIYREIFDNWIWEDKPFSKGQAWIDLILLAKFKDEKFAFKDSVVEGKRGTVYKSISNLADRWGWSRDKVRRFLRQLESDGSVQLKPTVHNTSITVINYSIYQDVLAADNTTNRQQTDRTPPANRQNAATYNKGE